MTNTFSSGLPCQVSNVFDVSCKIKLTASQQTSLMKGTRFSKVPKLYGPFSGVIIPSVSQERRGFEKSIFTVSLLFVTLKTCLKIGFPEEAVGRFTNGFSAHDT